MSEDTRCRTCVARDEIIEHHAKWPDQHARLESLLKSLFLAGVLRGIKDEEPPFLPHCPSCLIQPVARRLRIIPS